MAPPVAETLGSVAPASAPACHPSYSGVCLDPSAADYDCLSEFGDGPKFTPGPFSVVGPDIFALDPDRNGIGCEAPQPAPPPIAQTTAPAAPPLPAAPQVAATAVVQAPAPVPTAPPRIGSAGGQGVAAPRPTATPVLTRGTVIVNFAGAPVQKPTVSVAFGVQPGQTAWTAVRQAIGQSNLTFQDFGGSLGIFITGFYGVQAQGNHFWEFFVNGQSSLVGVSAYIVKSGDVLEFRYSSF
jgi:hypothetical protein